jgi:hypothetical protein
MSKVNSSESEEKTNSNNNNNIYVINTLNSLSGVNSHLYSPKENILSSQNNNDTAEKINEYSIEAINMSEDPKLEENNSLNIYTIFNFAEKIFLILTEDNTIVNKYNEYIINSCYKIFFQNFKLQMIYMDDLFIEDANQELVNKIKHFKMRKVYDEFYNNVKIKIRNKKFRIYNNQQCEKFIKYKKYKLLDKILENLKFYTEKRKEWLRKIKKEIKMPTVW